MPIALLAAIRPVVQSRERQAHVQHASPPFECPRDKTPSLWAVLWLNCTSKVMWSRVYLHLPLRKSHPSRPKVQKYSSKHTGCLYVWGTCGSTLKGLTLSSF